MKSNLLTVFLCILLIGSLSTFAQAQDGKKLWTAAASTGTVGDIDKSEIVFNGPIVSFALGINEGVATLRYNVVALDGLFGTLTPTSWPAIVVRYRDDGPNESVVVRLKEVVLSGPDAGTSKTVITFDSDEFPQSASFQTQSIGNCGKFGAFDFVTPNADRAYFLEVQLAKNPGGAPRVAELAISRYGVCQDELIQR